MILIKSDNYDVYFNLAMEEYIFNKFREDDVFILWVNSPSVVVGKHQNLIEEVNLRYCYENNINIARRISGGGTVFHDFGNVNYTYITNSTGDTGVDFKEFIKPIYKSLRNMGIAVEISPRNDLKIGEYKVCGHAEYMRNKRVLHHGCILFNSNLENLSKSLKVETFEVISSAVKSVRSKVCNIYNKLEKKFTAEDFILKLKNEIINMNSEKEIIEYNMDSEDIKKIIDIMYERYKKDEWIYGLSPKSEVILSSGLRLSVENGKIMDINAVEFDRKFLNKYFKYDEISILNVY